MLHDPGPPGEYLGQVRHIHKTSLPGMLGDWDRARIGKVSSMALSPVESRHSGTENWVIPVVTLRVARKSSTTAAKNYESTEVLIENYFITPEDARVGKTARKLSFTEAINRMAFG